MNSGVRHKVQRSNRVRLKADAVVLLDRIAALMDGGGNKLWLEIAEMRMRREAHPGCKAPIVRTGYTR